MTSTADADRAVSLLGELGWYREPDLVVQGRPDRPVFSRGQFKVIVGPLWVTHYRLVKETVLDQDSIKTADFDLIDAKIRKMK